MFFARLREALFRPSLRTRLTVLYTLIFGATTIAFNAFLFVQMMDTLQKDFDDALYNYAVDVSDSIEIGPKGDLTFPPLHFDDGKILPFPLGTALIQVRHASGKVLAKIGDFGEFDPPFRRDFQQLENGDEAAYRTVTDTDPIPDPEADSYRLISLPLDSAAQPQIILQIAVPMALLEAQFANRLYLLQIGIPALLLISVLAGLFVASRALNPLRRVIETAKSIDASELSQRVQVPRTRDEMRDLAQTLNDMLTRIESAFASQDRFIADASHQLLTPLAIMKGELEVFNKTGRAPEELDAFLRSTRQEIDSLSRIVQDMLLLARVDAGLGALNPHPVELEDLLFEVLPRCERLAANRAIRLVVELSGPDESRQPLRGDADLLGNLLTNIIENAIKYSPAEATVKIELEWKETSVELRVRDQGPGIPNEELSQIFERFRRGSGADLRAKGFGLGLAISSKIARLHGATLSASNHPEGGAEFRLDIKKN